MNYGDKAFIRVFRLMLWLGSQFGKVKSLRAIDLNFYKTGNLPLIIKQTTIIF